MRSDAGRFSSMWVVSRVGFEKDDRVDARPPPLRVAVAHPRTDEAEVQLRLELPVEVVRWDIGIERDRHEPLNLAFLLWSEHQLTCDPTREHLRAPPATQARLAPVTDYLAGSARTIFQRP